MNFQQNTQVITPLTFVTRKRFVVLFFLPSCCVNSLLLPPSLLTLLIHSTVLGRKNCTLTRDCVSTSWRHCLRKYAQYSLSQAKLKFNLKPLLIHDNYPIYYHEFYVWINCISRGITTIRNWARRCRSWKTSFNVKNLFVCLFSFWGRGWVGGRGQATGSISSCNISAFDDISSKAHDIVKDIYLFA